MKRNEINTILNEYADIDTPIEQEEETMVDTFEIIPFSQSEQDYHVDDEPFYGDIGLAMGWQYEARNVRDKRFPVGKLLYFDVNYMEAMPEAEADFMNFYAEDLGWELTGRVVFRGYGRLYWYAPERDWCVAEVTPEEIQRARELTEGWD